MTVINFDSLSDELSSNSVRPLTFKEVFTKDVPYEEVLNFLSVKGPENLVVCYDGCSLTLNLQGLELSNKEVLPAFMQIAQCSPQKLIRIVVGNGALSDQCWTIWLDVIKESEMQGLVLGFGGLNLSPVQIKVLGDYSKLPEWPISGYDFQSLSNLDEILDFLGSNSTYNRLTLCKMGITDAKITRLVNILMKAVNLSYLSLNHNPITDQSASLLMVLIQGNRKITTLNLGEISLRNPVNISRHNRAMIGMALQRNLQSGNKRKAESQDNGFLEKISGSVEQRREVLEEIFNRMNGLSEEERRTYYLQLLSKDFEHRIIPHDNHCFFHAVLQRISELYPKFNEEGKIDHLELRKLLVEFLKKNKENYSNYCPNFEEHCRDMLDKGWASQIDIIATSEMLIEMGYPISIGVFDFDHKPHIAENGSLKIHGPLEGKEGAEKIYLLHLPGHFDLLVPK